MPDLKHWPMADNSGISAAAGRKKPLSRRGKAGHPVVGAVAKTRIEKPNRPLRSEARTGRMMMSGTGS
ncbi:hypothetical protein JQ616_33070 [Bradyrhizobium tropiciagri]|uniref:hypothetical protein n=1 Tax=Bradyrhizobium tropiciagri TaxID=312253 RepID=UPI001BA6C90A|nr:hypothetical protein [Bradyrhizobium tropiciagri]MBR0899810.1 hypothetical protein [Bradyrhizobium tropiciagri]